MPDDLDRKIAAAEGAVTEAESNFGPQHVAVAERLAKLAALLREKNRALDAVNCEARARVIWENNPGALPSRTVKPVTPPKSTNNVSDKAGILESLKELANAPLSMESVAKAPKSVWIALAVCALGMLALTPFILQVLQATMGIGGALLAVAFTLFLPYTLAKINRKKNATRILLVNALLGWTVIGWIVALIWAVGKDEAQAVIVAGTPATGGSMKACPDCAESVKALANKCRFCGYLFEN